MLNGSSIERNTALEVIYRQNRANVFSYVRSNSGTDAEAGDVFQECIIAFYENVKKGVFKGESKISTYVYAIARFKWLNQIKKDKVRTLHQEESAEKDEIEMGPLFTMIDKEQRTAVHRLLSELGETCRQVLVESIYHGASMKEIADLGNFSSEQVVRNKKYKCLQQLKKLLKDNPTLIKILQHE